MAANEIIVRKVLVLGAGKSSFSLLDYLMKSAADQNWQVKVVDQKFSESTQTFQQSDHIELKEADISDNSTRFDLISGSDIVVSMLPTRFHELVAKDCLRAGRNMVTASYISNEMRSLTDEVQRKGLIFLNECGLDPGIDHMSAMKVLDFLRNDNCEITAFETFTGGLLAPNDHNDNPWEYKFTWNPRNVVMAGTGVVKFIQEGKYKYIPYQKLFRRTETIFIPGYGYFEGYANRDSLKYIDIYGLRGIKTLYRGTLRRPGFCRTWDIFVQIGATDDTYEMENVARMTHREFLNSFLSYNTNDSVELKLAHYLNLEMDGPEMNRLKWAGLFSDETIGINSGTPARILEHILKKKWTLLPDEHDMIIMWHKFNFIKDGEPREIHSTLVATGEDQYNTAMAKTVGLPLGIATKLILNGEVKLAGVKIPIQPEIYNPVLDELEKLGFVMTEEAIDPAKENNE